MGGVTYVFINVITHKNKVLRHGNWPPTIVPVNMAGQQIHAYRQDILAVLNKSVQWFLSINVSSIEKQSTVVKVTTVI